MLDGKLCCQTWAFFSKLQRLDATPGGALPSIPLSFSLATILSPEPTNIDFLRRLKGFLSKRPPPNLWSTWFMVKTTTVPYCRRSPSFLIKENVLRQVHSRKFVFKHIPAFHGCSLRNEDYPPSKRRIMRPQVWWMRILIREHPPCRQPELCQHSSQCCPCKNDQRF